jgi:PAS domain S-box-containing protein
MESVSSGSRDSEWHNWKVKFNLDGTSELIEISEGMQALYGYTAEELRAPEAWQRVIPEEELPKIEEANQTVLAQGWWHGNVRIRPKHGDILILEMVSMVESTEGGTAIVSGRLRNVTEQAVLDAQRHEHEARLRVLNERIRFLLWSCDTQLRITWLWGGGLEKLGRHDNDGVGMSLLDFFETTDENFAPIAAEKRALQGEQVTYEFSWKEHAFRCTVEPHKGPLGDVIGTIATAVDIGDKALLEESVTLAREVGAPRLSGEAAWAAPSNELQIIVGDLTIDLDSFEVRRNGDLIELTPTEFRLLVELAAKPGKVVSQAALLNSVWGHDFLGSSSLISMAVSRLRSKIEPDPSNPTLIENVRGFGYRLRMPTVT